MEKAREYGMTSGGHEVDMGGGEGVRIQIMF